MKNDRLTFRNGIKDGLPIGLGYLSVSFAFGVTASALNIPYYISLLISATNLTSAGQLAGISVIAGCGTVIEMLLTQLIINSRYFLMSLSLSQKTDDSFTVPIRLFCSAGITDEIFAVAVSKPQQINSEYFTGLMTLPYVDWTAGTLIGALSGNVLPHELISALGISLYAMFIAIIIPPSIKSKSVLFTVFLGALFSCVFRYVPYLQSISSGFTYIICAVASAVVSAIIFPIKSDDTGESTDENNDQPTDENCIFNDRIDDKKEDEK